MSSNNPKPRKPKSPLSQEKYSAELTSGQLVVGTSVLLLALLVAFMFGVLVGRFQPTNGDKAFAAANPQGTGIRDTPPEQIAAAERGPVTIDLPRPRDMAPVSSADSGEGRQTSPRLDALDAAPSESPTPATTAPGPDERAPNDLPLADPGASSKPNEAVSQGEVPTANAQTAPTSLEDIEPPPPSRNPGDPQDTAQPNRDATPTVPTSETPTQITAPRAAAGNFTVRIAAFGQRPNAERAKAALERATSGKFPGEIVDSPTGRLVYLFAGRYPGRADAEEARKELRDTYKYTDCYVEERSRS
ncbi:MAG: SPOR domain-containing protein [Candidatus Hydrogenedentota bacterium]